MVDGLMPSMSRPQPVPATDTKVPNEEAETAAVDEINLAQIED